MKQIEKNTEVVAVFNYKGLKLKPNQKAPIHIKIYWFRNNKRMRRFIPIGVGILASEWDKKTAQVNSKCGNYLRINKLIRDVIDYISTYELNLLNKGQVLTVELLDELLLSKVGKEDSFTEFYRSEIDPLIKRGTRKEFQYTLNLLTEFRANILFSEINLTLIQEFEKFMQKKQFKQNTIHKHHKHVKRFLILASQKGKFQANDNPYQYFTSKKGAGSRINLTVKELEEIEGLALNADEYKDLELIRDMFVFSCYTGLRFSDVDTLRKEHLIMGNDGLMLHKKMEKVDKDIVLPIDLLFNGKPRAIIDKYIAMSKDARIFPSITNQSCNRRLKSLAIAAKVKMNLTFHISRHTFGTLLADITQNPYLIMDLMGHSDIKTSMIYIHRSQERINKQLRVVNWSLS